MRWTREEFESDKVRYQAELKRLTEHLGLSDDHPLVKRQRRRIETVERVLTDPAYGIAEVSDGTP